MSAGFHRGKESLHFHFGQGGGQAAGTSGADGIKIPGVQMKNFSVEKYECIQGLILGGRRHAPADGEISQETLDFGRSYLSRMPLIMKEYVTLDPFDIGLFSADRVVFELDDFTGLIEQFLFRIWNDGLGMNRHRV